MAGTRKTGTEQRHPQGTSTISRVMRCLELIESSAIGLSTTEVAQMLGTSRPTAARLLGALAKGNYLRKRPDSAKYVLGLRLFELGVTVATGETPLLVARREMTGIVAHLQRTVDFVVLDGDDIFRLERMSWSSGLILSAPLPLRRPWYQSAAGLVIVAYSPPTFSQERCRRASASNLNGRILPAELEAIREVGYAKSQRLGGPLHFGLGVPIRDRSGYAIAALGMPTTEAEQDPGVIDALLDPLKDTAERISEGLGWSARTGTLA